MSQLTRYWITFEFPPLENEGLVIGTWWRLDNFGVTATDVDDAVSILRREWFDRNDIDVPPVREVVADVNVSELPDHVRVNMNPPNWRGMWYPQTPPLR